MANFIIILNQDNRLAAEARQDLPQAGGDVLHTYGSRVVVLDAPVGSMRSLVRHPGVTCISEGPIAEVPEYLSEGEQLGVHAWNARHQASFRASKQHRRGEGRSWGDPDFEPEG